MNKLKIEPWIRESNLIEGVDDPLEDARSQRVWKAFLTCPALDTEVILQLHLQIMRKHLDRAEAGRFRTCAVIVGGRICPPWQAVEGLHNLWLDKWAGAVSEEMIRQAHVAWEKIHPFVDGNGRTGRMIMNWQRVKVGLEPLLIRSDERQDYYGWFK